MGVTFEILKDLIRGTDFVYRGQPTDLRGALGERIMSNTLLGVIIHAAGNEVQLDIKAKREIKHNHCILGSDALPLPSDLLILNKIVIYDDDNVDVAAGVATGGSGTTLQDSAATFVTSGVAVGHRVDSKTDGSSALVTTVNSETLLTFSGGLTGGSDNTFASGDSYSIYDPDAKTQYAITEGVELKQANSLSKLTELRDDVSGKPRQYGQYEQSGTQFALWDVKADKRYFVDTFYYPELVDMADADGMRLGNIYQNMYYYKACEHIALRLADYNANALFGTEYEKSRARIGKISKSRSNSLPKFHEMP